jgi:hypothetical protein
MATHVYIVFKGEFETSKRLPRGDKVIDGVNLGSTLEGGGTSGSKKMSMDR